MPALGAAEAQRSAALSLHVNDIPEFEDARRTAEHVPIAKEGWRIIL